MAFFKMHKMKSITKTKLDTSDAIVLTFQYDFNPYSLKINIPPQILDAFTNR